YILIAAPSGSRCTVAGVTLDSGEERTQALAGDNLRIKLNGIDEDRIAQGSVLCSPDNVIKHCTSFTSTLMIMEAKNVISSGSEFVFHSHAVQCQCKIKHILAKLDKKTGAVVTKKPSFVTPGSSCAVTIELAKPVCLEAFDKKSVHQRFGRFILRAEDATVAIGTIKKVKA
ncbi:hypothetical protein KIPB_004265, partial [Kipferlia bialata]